jgi:hypothetical protein
MFHVDGASEELDPCSRTSILALYPKGTVSCRPARPVMLFSNRPVRMSLIAFPRSLPAETARSTPVPEAMSIALLAGTLGPFPNARLDTSGVVLMASPEGLGPIAHLAREACGGRAT